MERLWTDASGHGYCDTREIAPDGMTPRLEYGYGVWEGEQGKESSNWHELATIVMSVRQHIDELRGGKIHYITDNTVARSAVNNGKVKSPKLMEMVRELRLLQARGDIDIEAFHLPGKLIVAQGSDGGSRQVPYLGQLGSRPRSHDAYDPTAWPCFPLTGEVAALLDALQLEKQMEDCSEVRHWGTLDPAGRETYWHVRPRHAVVVLRWLLDAQLRQPRDTGFTVVTALADQRAWRPYIKHFRRRRRILMWVEGLGWVPHMVLQYQKGDGLMGKRAPLPEEHWNAEAGRWGKLGSASD